MSQFESSLSSLLAALKGGLNATDQGQGLLSGIMDQRAQQQAQRQSEMSDITNAIMSQAQGGSPYGSVDTMLSTLAASGQIGPRQQDRLQSTAMTAYGADPQNADMAYYQEGGGGYGKLSDMLSLDAARAMEPAEPDYDAMTAQVLPEVSQLITQAFANGKSMGEVKQAIVSDPTLSVLYVRNPSLFDDLIEQGALSGVG